MPPKVKVTRENIINAAVDIVKKSGAQALNARTVASVLNCSTQPIFSNFSTMDELRLAVAQKAAILCKEYIRREVESKAFPPYKASGMAYIQFAKEEKELFKILFMRERLGNALSEEIDLNDQMEQIVQHNTGLNSEETKLFHLEMWVVVHGIAAMTATGSYNFERELASKILTDSYQGLRKQYGLE